MNIEIEAFKKSINKILNVDLSSSKRDRKIVDAKKIYSKILRERGYGLQTIGDSINRNHSTIIFYLRDIDSLILYDEEFRNKYITCKELFENHISYDKFLILDFIKKVEEYEKEYGRSFTIQECRDILLPLINL